MIAPKKEVRIELCVLYTWGMEVSTIHALRLFMCVNGKPFILLEIKSISLTNTQTRRIKMTITDIK